MRIPILLLLAVILAGCGSARRGEAVTGAAPALSLAAQQGEKVFMAQCHQCHPRGESGLGPGLNNRPLPGFLMRFQVRHGLGAMPSFPPEAISAADLDAVVAFLKEIR